jgi:hypothetical protein
MSNVADEGALPEKSFIFYIDVFSYCNLRCPSCLVGARYGELSEWPRGLMSPDLLGRILDKALRECRIEAVGLYNWTAVAPGNPRPRARHQVARSGLLTQLQPQCLARARGVAR